MQDFPHIRAVLEGPVADLVLSAWSAAASDHVATGNYSSYLSFEKLFGYGGNDLAVAVANNAEYARYLEDGHSGFHMPERIDWSGPHVKTSKAGRRYLIIPLRHFSPTTKGGGSSTMRARGAMPRDVYNDALTALRGDRTRRQARAAAARLTAAGPRLSRPYNLAPFPAALRDRALQQEGQPGYTHRAGKYEGLTRSAQIGAGGRESGSFHTFRVMTEDSVGWWIPPSTGFGFAAKTVETVRDQVRDLVGEAARADVVQLVQVEVGS